MIVPVTTFCHLIVFGVLVQASELLAATLWLLGGSLIVCSQKSRLSYSSSLIAASTSLDAITAFAVFLWAADWTEEKMRNLNYARAKMLRLGFLEISKQSTKFSVARLICSFPYFIGCICFPSQWRWNPCSHHAGEDQLPFLTLACVYKPSGEPACLVHF